MSAGATAPDLTTGPIGKTLLMFTLPTLASNILQSLNGSINAIWVGRFIGENGLAATASANIIMFLLLSLMFGIGMAATVAIGQATGARDIDAVRRTFGSAVGFSVIIAIVVAGIGWIAAPRILYWLSTPAGAYPLALAYLRIIFISMPFGLIAVMITMCLRGAGDAITPLKFMILTAILDAGLNPLLILGVGPFPQWGIAGSAAATAIASIVTLVALIIYLYRADLPLRLRGPELRYLRPAPEQVRLLMTKGVPMGLQMIIMSAAGIIMVGLVNREGLLTAAAYSASQQLWTYVQMPAIAVGAGVSAMAAQNIGAGKWERVDAITRNGLMLSFLITSTLIGVLLLFDRPALGLFLGMDSPAIAIARRMQLIASWSFLLFGLAMVFISVMRANGVVVAPLIILLFALLPVRLGFYEVLYPAVGVDALWMAFPVGAAAVLVLAAALYRHGGWRTVRPMAPPTKEECIEAAQAEADPAGRMSPTG